MKKISILFFFTLYCFISKAQLMADSLLIDGHYRVFYFNKPQPQNTNSSLVFILHGSGGDPHNMVKRATKLEAKAQSENLIIAYPKGYKNCWNDCRKASNVEANLINIDENTFFEEMIKYFKSKYQTNDKQVFAIGFSGGGHMVYKLAITMPKKIKAITAIVANLPDSNNMDCTESKLPIAVMIVNSTSDPINPYLGGEVKAEGLILGNVRSTEQTFKYWASIDGYQGNPLKEVLLNTDTTDQATIEQYTYKKKNKPEVVLLKVLNGKHEFPKDIDVFVEAWAFFKRQIKK